LRREKSLREDGDLLDEDDETKRGVDEEDFDDEFDDDFEEDVDEFSESTLDDDKAPARRTPTKGEINEEFETNFSHLVRRRWL